MFKKSLQEDFAFVIQFQGAEDKSTKLSSGNSALPYIELSQYNPANPFGRNRFANPS